MKIIATGLSYNEADVVEECVASALSWCDEFVLYDNSTDDTPELAEKAGAIVIRGDVGEPFAESMRQNCLDFVNEKLQDADWIVRVDPDEFYPYGVKWQYREPHDPREDLKIAEARGLLSVRADVVQFWITLNDVVHGLILEDPSVSVQERRRWYSVGHTAVVAWQHNPTLRYAAGGVHNTPIMPNGTNIGQFAGAPSMIQTHYTCRSWDQLWKRSEHRRKNKKAFGKYTKNLVVDQTFAHLHYWEGLGSGFVDVKNHENLYLWFEVADRIFRERHKGA